MRDTGFMSNQLSRKVIVIQGYLASGKSTFARLLSNSLGIPCFVKDTFKTALCAGVEINSREDSSRFSAVTFNAMMYASERLMESGYPLIIEGNFVPAGIKPVDESGVIKALIVKHSYNPLTFKFMGDTHILHKRFVDREGSDERGQANKMFSEVKYDDFNQWCQNLDRFYAGGEVINVDTTDFSKVDFLRLIDTARHFIECDRGR